MDALSMSAMHDRLAQWLQDNGDIMLWAVLATSDTSGMPHSRSVVVRQIEQVNPLFFTQAGSRKVQHIQKQPQVAMTLMLAKQCRQVIWRGRAEALTVDENQTYWQTYPKASQARFMAYGPRSGQPIESNDELDRALQVWLTKSKDTPLPMPDAYVGYRIIPTHIDLYEMYPDRISASYQCQRVNDQWQIQRVVP